MTFPESESSSEVSTRKSSENLPLGVRFLRWTRIPSPFGRITTYRITILLLTYVFYVNYHSARRPFGVVKNVLRQNCANLTPPWELTEKEFRNGTWCQWAPFNKNSQELFSALDFIYRFFYATGMIVAGYIAERTDLRLFLSFGMIGAGFWAIFHGMAYFWEVHYLSYFVVAQVLGGIFQGTGWPAVVPLMGNWYSKRRQGFIFGVWNSHTSVGNILGAVIAGVFVNDEWGYSFIVPGLMIVLCGVLSFLFVVPHPHDVGLDNVGSSGSKEIVSARTSTVTCESVIEDTEKSVAVSVTTVLEQDKRPISMWEACKIPGVIEYSLCLFFSKAVYYTFFFWLPVYIKSATDVGHKSAADLSAVFDAGGIIGGIIAGAVSDATGGSATVCGVMFILAIPSLYCMVLYASHGMGAMITILVISGLFVNGPYALITTAVSTDLGTRPTLTKSRRSLATVAGIIDGMGSLGSAVGPLGAGLLAALGWNAVFYYLIIAQVVALLCLVRLIYREVVEWIAMAKNRRKRPVARIIVPELVQSSKTES